MAAPCIKSKIKKEKRFLKTFLLFSFLFGSFFGFNINTAHAADAWYSGGVAWGYRVKVTINASQVPSTQTNFPVYVNLANLPAGFFSHVKSDGSDIRVTNSAGTELAREIETINTSASTGVLWFKANSISDSAYYYIYYGNSGASEPSPSSTYGSQKVWDDGGSNYFKGVWHLKETLTAAGQTVLDSTGANNGTSVGTWASNQQVSGIAGGALKFNGTDNRISGSGTGSLRITGNNITMEAWFYCSGSDSHGACASSNGYLLGKVTSQYSYSLSVDPASQQFQAIIRAGGVNYSATGFSGRMGDLNAYLNSWVHFVTVYNGSTIQMYANGVPVPSAPVSASGNLESTTDGFAIGDRGDSKNSPFNNNLDEVRVSASARSADWIKTEYNNQSSSTSFYLTGGEETSATVPDAPTSLTPTAGNAQVALSWTAPANNGGSAISDYAVDFKTTSTTTWLNFGHTASTATSTIVAGVGLINGTAYNFRVSAVNAVGQGPPSGQATSTPATVPDAPTIGTATRSNAQATITFSAPGSTGGSAITSYTVTSSTGGHTGTGSGSPIVVTGLTNGTAYTFTVTATNSAGTGSPSSPSNSVTPATVPGVPTSVTAVSGNNQASVSFSAPASTGGSTITSYTVTSSPGNFTGTGSASPVVVTGLTNGNTYTFTVTATNDVGTSSASSASSPLTLPTAPDVPTGLTPTSGNAQVALSWTAPSSGGSSITDYIVDYKLTSEPTVWTTFSDGVSAGTTAMVTGLTNGSSYDFRVSAVNAVGQGSASSPAASTPATVPGAPTIGTATAGNAQASVAFTLLPSPSVAPWYGTSGWTYRKKITIDKTKVPNTNQTNFPVLVSLTGLSNINTSGTDIRFTSSNGTTELAREIESYSAGTLVAWVKVPTLSTSANTDIYMYYGNSSATEPATNSTYGSQTVWSNSFAGVWHLGEASGTSYDSTANGQNGRDQGSPTHGIGGMVGNAIGVVSSWRQYGISSGVVVPNNALFRPGSGNFTVSVWVNKFNPSTSWYNIGLLGKWNSGGAPGTNEWYMSGTSSGSDEKPFFSIESGTTAYSISADSPEPLHTWYQLTAVRDGTNLRLYVNGVPVAAPVAVGNVAVNSLSNNVNFGYFPAYTDDSLNGDIDEAEYSGGVARSAEWIKTEYNNQNNPASFYAVADAENVNNNFATNGGSAITAYTVTSSPGGIQSASTTSPIIVTGLTNGTAYTFTVTATNGMGTGPSSASTTPVTPATVPSAPLAVSATAGNAQVSLSWNPPSSNGGSAITDYSVDYKFHASSSPSDWMTFAHTPSTATSTIVTGLTNGSQYDFRVSAVNDVNKGSPSDPPVTSTPITVPNAPTSVTAVRGNAQATVTFTAPVDTGGSPITGYSVTSIPAGGIDSNSGSTALSHVVTNLVNGTAYTFTVVASNLAGPSVPSSPSSPAVTPATVPNAPTLPSAVRGNALATVTFTAPDSNGSPITSYLVTSVPDGRTGTGSASPVTVNGLTNGTPYTFSVVAINDVGPSSPSVSTVAVTPMTVPGAPTIGTTTPSNTQVSVEFTPPVSNGGSTITSYTASSSPGNFTGTGSASPIVVSGLTNGTHYTFTVTATNEVGTGSASSASTIATPFTIPDPPTGLTPTAGAGQVGLTWVAPAINGGADITDYVIDYKFTASTSPSDWITFAHLASTATTFTVTGLANGVSYDFRVSAKNAAGPGSASGIATAMPVTVPDAPTVVSVVPDNARATVTFNSPAFNGGNTITGYTVTSNPGNFTVSGVSSPLTVTGLTNGTPYTFVVTASNALGAGAPSASSSPVIPVTVPGAPTGVSAVEGNTLATVSFAAPDGGGSTILDYTITSNPGNISTTTTSTTGVVTGLTNGATYTFTVTARNAVGTGSVSAPSNPVKLSTEPDAPVNLAAVVYGSSIGLTWSAPASDGGAAITDYVVEYQLTTGGTWSVFADGGSASTSATVVGLSDRISYDFRVRAKNVIGPSLPSNVVTATPGEPAQVRIMSFPDLTAPSIATEVLITNEGSIEYEYQYTWCVTDSETNLCGGGDDIFSATAAKLIGSHADFDTNASSTVLTPGNYWFHINVLYGSRSSSADQSFTVVATYPDAPTSVVATSSNAQASVSFIAPASNGGSAITGYTVTSNPGGLTGVGGTSPIVVTGLTNGTSYTFTVTATNAIGTGPVSSPPSNSVMPVTVPDAPTGVLATAGNGQVALSWAAPLITGGLPIIDYIVEYKLSSEPTTWTLVADPISSVTTATVTGLTNGSSYDFRVSAVNDFGRSVVNATSATLAGTVTPPSTTQGGGSSRSGGGRVYQPTPTITNTSPIPEAPNTSPITEVVSPAKINKPSSSGVSTIVSPTVPKNEVSATPTENPVATTLPTSPVSSIAKENNGGLKIPWVPIAGFAGVVIGGGFIYFVLRRRHGMDADR